MGEGVRSRVRASVGHEAARVVVDDVHADEGREDVGLFGEAGKEGEDEEANGEHVQEAGFVRVSSAVKGQGRGEECHWLWRRQLRGRSD